MYHFILQLIFLPQFYENDGGMFAGSRSAVMCTPRCPLMFQMLPTKARYFFKREIRNFLTFHKLNKLVYSDVRLEGES